MTQPSLGVGYEIGRALEMKKDILCLFRPSDTEKSELIYSTILRKKNMLTIKITKFTKKSIIVSTDFILLMHVQKGFQL